MMFVMSEDTYVPRNSTHTHMCFRAPGSGRQGPGACVKTPHAWLSLISGCVCKNLTCMRMYCRSLPFGASAHTIDFQRWQCWEGSITGT